MHVKAFFLLFFPFLSSASSQSAEKIAKLSDGFTIHIRGSCFSEIEI